MMRLDTEGVSKFLLTFFDEAKGSALFAGAGVGAKVGLFTWPELMEHLAQITEKYNEKETADLIRKRYQAGYYLNAATIYKTCPAIPTGEIYKQIASKFTNSQHSKRLNAMVSLPFSAIFTTNYDRSLHDSYSEVVRRAAKTVELNDPTMRMALFDRDFYIARLHGRAEIPDSIVLDEVDYKELLSNQEYMDFLIHIFTSYNCLFIGFSFSDPAIKHVFEIIERRLSPNFPKLHYALLPDNADESFINRLKQFNIDVIIYDSSYDHFALWEGIKVASRQIPNEIKRDRPRPEFPLKPIQRFLATSYAQLKMSNTLQPLRDVVIDGMIITLIRESDNGVIGLSVAEKKLNDLLNVSPENCASILTQRIEYLVSEGKLNRNNGDLALIETGSYDLSDDIKILVQGVENRILVRHGGRIYPELLIAANNSIESVLLARGWDLGASYVGTDESNSLDISSTIKASVETHSSEISFADRERLYSACFDLFQNPDETESQVLALLGRVSFALQIIFNKPSEAVAHYSLLPEVIYFDSNVLMPAIVDGHPYQRVYRDALKRLGEACKNAGIPIHLAVAVPFLEEILHHRKIAVEEVASLSLEDPDKLYEHIQFHGGAANIFVFAYSSMINNLDERISFSEFLRKAAPYSDMNSLSNYVSDFGIRTTYLNFDDTDMVDFHKYYNELKRHYDEVPEYQRKQSILIEHEARQLLKVKIDLDKRFRVLFVTMDNRLRRFSTGPILGYPGSALITHSGLIQLIDLLIGFQSDSGSVARLLWGSFITDDKMIIINYFTNLALRTYDEAMAMSLPEVLDNLVPEVTEAARKVGLIIKPGGDSEHKERIAKFMDRFEDRFYENMAEVIKKRQNMNN